MSPDFLLVYILFVHYVADFICQTRYQAMNKSRGKSFFNDVLFGHVLVYSIIWFLAWVAVSPTTGWGLLQCFEFSVITFICHYTTDYFTSRINKYFFDKLDYHNGFNGVGAYQILHYLQLWFTFKMLTL